MAQVTTLRTKAQKEAEARYNRRSPKTSVRFPTAENKAVLDQALQAKGFTMAQALSQWAELTNLQADLESTREALARVQADLSRAQEDSAILVSSTEAVKAVITEEAKADATREADAIRASAQEEARGIINKAEEEATAIRREAKREAGLNVAEARLKEALGKWSGRIETTAKAFIQEHGLPSNAQNRVAAMLEAFYQLVAENRKTIEPKRKELIRVTEELETRKLELAEVEGKLQPMRQKYSMLDSLEAITVAAKKAKAEMEDAIKWRDTIMDMADSFDRYMKRKREELRQAGIPSPDYLMISR